MVYTPAAKRGKIYTFLPKWHGPLNVLAMLNELNYRVASLDGKKILVIHVQRMRTYKPWAPPRTPVQS